MKNKLFYILFLSLLISCNKEKQKILSQYNGTATALKNGTAWEARIRTNIYENNPDHVYFSFEILDKKYAVSQELSISNIKTEIKTEKITRRITDSLTSTVLNTTPYANFFNKDGGDLIESYYETDSTKNNFITITKSQPSDLIFEGSFDITLINNYQGSQFPDTLHFTNGYFNSLKK